VLCEFSTFIARLLRDRGVEMQVVQQSAREDWIQALVRANFGVAFMPESIARASKLDHVRTVDVPIARQVSVLVQADRPVLPTQQFVINSLRAHDWGTARRLAA
jgi:DNA-binding transcriptional LysR family regulator